VESAPQRLAVIILNWNGREHLERCVPSVLASRGIDVRVIVADNGSVDDSLSWLREAHPSVEIVANNRNLRFAAGNNAAAEVALERGYEFLLFLNNDARIAHDALAEIVSAFDRDPSVGLIGPRIDFDDGSERLWYGGGLASFSWGWFGHRAIRKRSGEGFDPAGPTDWVTGCALAIRSALWTRLGGLDDGYYIYAEDTDLSLRARALGAEIRYLPTARVWHAVSASVGGSRSAFKTYHQHRSRGRLLRRHLRPWHWPSALLGVLGQDLALLGYLLLRGNPAAAWSLIVAVLDEFSPSHRYRVN